MRRSLILITLACICGLPALASAQVGGPDLRIGAGMVLDFGGELDGDGGPDPDLEATFGLRGHVDYDIARYVSVGGFLRLAWWEAEEGLEERSFLFDLGPRITGHYDWRDFRFYVAGMPGLVISKVDDDANVDNPAAGFTMSLTPGMEYWFTPKFAAFVEIFGWVGHYFDHDAENGPGEVDVNMNQVLFEFGAVFAP